jgi:hypothetical protein
MGVDSIIDQIDRVMHRRGAMLRSKASILSVTLAAGSCSSGQIGSPTHDGSEVAVTIQGMIGSLAPNTSARVGSYLVVVGASEQETGPGTGNCLDWYVSRTEIGIAP